MTKTDPIIAVKDVQASSKWYQAVFGCRSMHGGDEFDILIRLNPNSRRKEFSLRDPDGCYLTITEFHKYEG